jgi:hypothetical protein
LIKLKLFIQIAITGLITLAVVGIIETPVWGDEKHFHIPNAINFSFERVVSPDSDYASAYAPLPYLMGYMVWQIYPSYFTLRLLNLLIFFGLLILFFKINENLAPHAFILTLLLIANPYLVRSAYSFYMFNYGLFFVLLGIYLQYYSNWRFSEYLSSFSLALAVLSQQWMLIVVASIYMVKFRELVEKKAKSDEWYSGALQIIIALGPGLLLFASWKGMTHPNFASHALSPTFAHLTGTLANWGFAFILLVFTQFKSVFDVKYLPFLFIVVLLFLGLPIHSYDVGPESVSGIATRIFGEMSNKTGIPFGYLFIFPVLAGLILLIKVVQNYSEEDVIVYAIAVIGFLTAFTASVRLGASHIYLSIPFLIMVFKREIIESKRLQFGLSLQLYLITIIYNLYIIYIKAPKLV